MPLIAWIGLKLLGIRNFLKSIPPRVWVIICLVLLLLIIMVVLNRKTHEYLQHNRDVQAQNDSLTKRNSELNTQVNSLTQINQENLATYQEKVRQAKEAQVIAEAERVAAERRSTHYRSIRDAAKATPQSDRHPVGLAVQSTVDRLWDQPEVPGH